MCRSKLAARQGGSRAVQKRRKRSEWRRTRARIAVPDLMRVAAQRATGPQIDSAQILMEKSRVDLPAESVAPEERDESTPPAAALNTAPEADKTARGRLAAAVCASMCEAS